MPDQESTDPNDIRLARLRSMSVDVWQFTQSDGFLAWLHSLSKFHHYSWSNTMLIAAQNPEATKVAGFRKWQEMGRQVRKGEKSIKILGPMIRKDKESGDEKLTGFRALSVFDISQTDGDELPELGWGIVDVPLDDGLLDHLIAGANADGITVSFAGDMPNGARGFYVPARRAITLGANFPRSQQVMTLLHELGHAYDPALTDSDDRAAKELVAESAKWSVLDRLGIHDAHDQTVAYLASWGRGVRELMDVAERICASARTIEEKILTPRADASPEVAA